MINYSTITKENLDFYNDEGYLMLPSLISAESADAAGNEVMEIMSIIGLGNSKLKQTTQYLENGALDKLVNSPLLSELASVLLGGEGSVYMPFTAVKSGGGGGVFHFHQDNQYTKFDKPGLNFWFALTDMSLENGCLQIVPRSHLSGTYEAVPSGDGDVHRKISWEPEDFVPIEMKKGDCVVFSRLTIHGSGKNTSGKHRLAYAIQFHRNDSMAKWGDNDWILLKENPRWNVKPVSKITPPEQVSLDGH